MVEQVAEKLRMRAPAWKSGASAPRKRFEINAGFSPRGHCLIGAGLLRQPVKPKSYV